MVHASIQITHVFLHSSSLQRIGHPGDVTLHAVAFYLQIVGLCCRQHLIPTVHVVLSIWSLLRHLCQQRSVLVQLVTGESAQFRLLLRRFYSKCTFLNEPRHLAPHRPSLVSLIGLSFQQILHQ